MRRCFYHTDLGQNAVFDNYILQYKLHSFNFHDDLCARGLLAKPLKDPPKKISKITYTASRFSQEKARKGLTAEITYPDAKERLLMQYSNGREILN